MKLTLAIIFLFPYFVFAEDKKEDYYYDLLRGYLTKVNEEIDLYMEFNNVEPEHPENINLEALNPYPAILEIEEVWWMPKADSWSITVNIKGTGKTISCSSEFSASRISCIRVSYDNAQH